MVFEIIYCICFSISTSLFLLQMAVSMYLGTSAICSYQSLSHSPPHQNFGSYFLAFGKCGVTLHRLHRGSLNLNFQLPTFIYFVFAASPLSCKYFPGQGGQDFKKPPPPPPPKEIYVVTPLNYLNKRTLYQEIYYIFYPI